MESAFVRDFQAHFYIQGQPFVACAPKLNLTKASMMTRVSMTSSSTAVQKTTHHRPSLGDVSEECHIRAHSKKTQININI